MRDIPYFSAILEARNRDPVLARARTIVVHFLSSTLFIHQESIFVLHILVSCGWSLATICSSTPEISRYNPRWYQSTTSVSSFTSCFKFSGPYTIKRQSEIALYTSVAFLYAPLSFCDGFARSALKKAPKSKMPLSAQRDMHMVTLFLFIRIAFPSMEV